MSVSPVAVGTRVRVVVPATTANLGPGFDTLGMALTLYDELDVVATDQGVVVDVQGVGEGDIPTDETNLVVKALLATFDKVGIVPPGIRLHATNRIPHGRGLGSSGSAIVGGVMAAKGLLEGLYSFSDDELLAIATDLEGHPDNITPALFGGLTIAWVSETGPRSKKLHTHRGVSLLVAIPVDISMSTHLARSLQPDTVPHKDAIFNLSRASLLIAALLDSPDLLLEATEDKLHQTYRASAMPETTELIRILRDAGHAAVVSGAGPSVLVLCSEPAERLSAQQVITDHGQDAWEVRLLTVDERGATVESLPALAE